MFSLAIAEKIALPMRIGSTIGYAFISERTKFLWTLTIFRRGEDFVATSSDPEDFVGLEISLARNQSHKQRGSGNALSGINSPAAAAISGWWKGDVTYG